VGINRAPSDYVRHHDRKAPYNLFTSTVALFRRAPAGAQPPRSMFAYRLPGAPAAAGAAPAGRAHMEFRGEHITTVVDWGWDGTAHLWRRSLDGAPHVDSGGTQVAVPNVVVLFVQYVDTGARDVSNTAVPEASLVGNGDAWILVDGQVVKGRWSRASPDAPFSLTDADGRQTGLTPGRAWVELAPIGSATLG